MLKHRNEGCKDFVCVNFEECKDTCTFDHCRKCPHGNYCYSKQMFYLERVRCFMDINSCSPCPIYGLCMLCERYKSCTRDDKIGYFGGRFKGLTAVVDYNAEDYPVEDYN